MFFVNLQVSDPHRRSDFTGWNQEILIFVHSEMNFDLHMGLKMENATCASLHLASTSSSVPPGVVIRLPRYVKADTCSICWGPNRHLLGFGHVHFENDPSSLFQQRRELLSHVGDPLTQQNHIVSKV